MPAADLLQTIRQPLWFSPQGLFSCVSEPSCEKLHNPGVSGRKKQRFQGTVRKNRQKAAEICRCQADCGAQIFILLFCQDKNRDLWLQYRIFILKTDNDFVYSLRNFSGSVIHSAKRKASRRRSELEPEPRTTARHKRGGRGKFPLTHSRESSVHAAHALSSTFAVRPPA